MWKPHDEQCIEECWHNKKCGQNWQQSRLAIKPLIHERNSMCSNRIWIFTGLFKWKRYKVTLKDLPEWSQWYRKREEEEAIPFPVILGNTKLEVLLFGILIFCQGGGGLFKKSYFHSRLKLITTFVLSLSIQCLGQNWRNWCISLPFCWVFFLCECSFF